MITVAPRSCPLSVPALRSRHHLVMHFMIPWNPIRPRSLILSLALLAGVLNFARAESSPGPSITAHSAARNVILPGQSQTLSITATGTGTLSYQWTHNGLVIPGATSNSYTISNATIRDNGYYLVTVTNVGGTVRAAPFFAIVAPMRTSVRAWRWPYTWEGLDDAIAVRTGRDTPHSLAIKRDGSLVARLENSRYLYPLLDAPPAGLSGVVDVAIGGGDSSPHAIALKSDGTVVAWGANGLRQTTIPADLRDIVQVAAGINFSLALKSDGTVIGIGMAPFSAVITGLESTSLTDIAAIAACNNHALALKRDGTVVGWPGGNEQVPAGLSGVVAIDVGDNYSVAIKSDGTVVYWGVAYSTDRLNALDHALCLSAGSLYGVGIKTDGTMVVWGGTALQPLSHAGAIYGLSAGAGNFFVLRDATDDPVIGTPPTIQGSTRRVVSPGDSLALSISAVGGGAHTYQWSRNGQPISGATSSTYSIASAGYQDSGYYLAKVTNPDGYSLSAPIFVVVAPTRTEVRAWGYSYYGGTTVPAGLTDAVAVTGGTYDAVATRRDGSLVTWGYNSFNGVVIPDGLTNVVTVSKGDAPARIILKHDGTVAYLTSIAPTPVPTGLNNVVAVAGPYRDTYFALRSDGRVVAWPGSDLLPPELDEVVALSVNRDLAMALRRDGTVVSWAPGSSYVSPNGSVIPAGLSNVVSLAVGSTNGFALRSDGTVAAWGYAGHGDLNIPSGLTNIVQLEPSAALKGDGTMTSWGSSGTAPVGLPSFFAISIGNVSLGLHDATRDTPPVFTTQPQGRTSVPGSSVTFTIAVTDSPAPTYQWKKNGVNIAGATAASYTIASVTVADAGSYTVVATNSLGSVTSNAAILTVVNPAAQGDLDGDGRADLIWQNRITGERSFWLMNDTAFGTGFAFWTVDPSWQIVGSGDFDGDGQNDLVWTNTLTGERSIWLMNGTAFKSGISLGTVPLDWQIAAIGSFNADGISDLVWQNLRTGECSIWLMNGESFTGVPLNTVPPEWQIVSSGDFNADGKSDLVWTNISTGERAIWLMNGIDLSSGVSLGIVPNIWQIVGSDDYNGDGESDVAWTNVSTGERTIWLMDGATHTSTVALGTVTLDWTMGRAQPVPAPVQSDFNGDANSDLIWQNLATGEHSLWVMNGTSFSSGVSLATAPKIWQIVASGDFNADGKSDIVWTNTATGERSFWLMNGTTFNYGVSLGTIPTNWQIVASGDFNGDGKSDLVWANTTTGERSIWLMNGTSYMAGAALTTLPTNWQIVASGDFNADGKSDLVWTDTSTGERSIWFMDGTAFSSGVSLGIVPLNLQIVGTGDFNADGKSDLVWTDTATGERTLWLMNGTIHSSTVSLGTVPTAWQIRN